MRLLIIVPRYNLTNKKDYTYFFPIGLANIYTAIKNKGYDIDCINLNHSEGLIKDLVNSQLDKNNYQVSKDAFVFTKTLDSATEEQHQQVKKCRLPQIRLT